MFFVIRDKIMQRKSVVRCHKINGCPGPPSVMIEYVRRGAESRRERTRGRTRFPELANGIAEFIVPFRPAGREGPHLVSARTAVPGLGNQFYRSEHWILAACF